MEYRELTLEEKNEIKRLIEEAKLKIKYSEGDSNSIVLNKIKEFILKSKENKTSKELIETYAYELGSLFGYLIQKEYDWNWYCLNKENETFYCITSKNKRACCAVHNYFYSILNTDKNNNSILLYNMIENTEYPKDWNFTFLN